MVDIAEVLEMSLDDIQSTRNGLFLCSKIEESFDKLDLSFVPVDILHPSQYKMVIWKDSCKTKSVMKGSLKLIGEYDEVSLELGELEPYRRALSYQALLAYGKLSISDGNKLLQSKPEYFGTPPKSSDLDRIFSLKSTTTHSEELTGIRNLGATLMTAIKEEGNKSDISYDDC
jgi:HNH endonuclease